MPWSRGCDRRRALGVFWAQKSILVHADMAPDGLVGAIERSDAVVNLAGEPLMGGRWPSRRSKTVWQPRLTGKGRARNVIEGHCDEVCASTQE